MKIVYVDVCADILHKGHLLQLRNAKALGDKLIVGVITDEGVMQTKPKPIIPFRERLELINSLSFVDCAVAQNEFSPLNNIKMIKPDILVESSSHVKYPDYLQKIKKEFKGRIIVMPYYPEISSSNIKESIRKQK